MKRCIKCGHAKPETEYYASPNTKGGLRHECKECLKAYGRRYRAGQPHAYIRNIRTVHNDHGSPSHLVAIPPTIYNEMGRPHAIRWTLIDGEVGMELME